MKLILSSLIVLTVLFVGSSYAYADVTISAVSGSGAPGCEETAEGCYTPNMATVNVGETIIFSNPDSAAHTFTSGNPDIPESIQTLFDSSLVMAGSTYKYTPESEGVIEYFCMVHPWMVGSIIVGSGDTTLPPAEPPIDPPTPCICEDTIVLQNEINELTNEVRDLKLENKQLKNEITALKDQIVSMTNEFVAALEQLNKWFGSQLS